MPNNPESRVIKNQITKSGTSIGANYREANRSRSDKDFFNKIQICESEASETVYWLELLMSLSKNISKETKLVFKEANELIAIFTSIRNSLKNK